MASVARRFINWAAAFEDGAIIRAAFFGLLSATGVILYLDYTELNAAAPVTLPATLSPILPDFDPSNPAGTPGPDVTTPMDQLRQPLKVELVSGGTLALTGTIDPGAAERVAAEIAAHGEYIKIVALDSPGGSVADALAIGRLLREKGLATSVTAGALCASSCPLVFAGGKDRIATAQSAIAVHQIYAATEGGTLGSRLAAAGNAMSNAQTMTAEISRYLLSMGVDAEVWLRALETPPDRLTYFSAEELTRLKLATRLTT
ncbi:MAG: ATP-dependent Clp protease proteolytic subunit [Devosia sp.]